MKIEFVDITLDERTDGFKCDEPRLNSFLEYDAYFEHIMCLSKTKLVKVNNKLVGYFTLALMPIKTIIQDGDDIQYMGITLKYLAVDEKYQNKGVGTLMLNNILPSCQEFANLIGCRCLYIDAVNSKIDWYSKRGFQTLDVKNDNLYNTTTPMIVDYQDDDIVSDYFDE